MLHTTFSPKKDITLMSDNMEEINQYDSDGMAHGLWEEYYSDESEGKKVSNRGHYYHGIEHGKWEWFHLSGAIKWKEEYLYGIPHGNWVTYTVNGYATKKCKFDRGELKGLFLLSIIHEYLKYYYLKVK